MARRGIPFVASALSLFLAGVSPALSDECRPDLVSLRGDWGKASFVVEIADDEAERSQGLMHRQHLPQRAGMLFVYPEPQPASFWMKNTLIPLDILFLDQAGTVTTIHANAIPQDLTPLPGGDEVFAVLEINGGLAARYGISIGTEMRHEVFSNSSPKWPC